MSKNISPTVVTAISFDDQHANAVQLERTESGICRLVFCGQVPKGESNQQALRQLRNIIPRRKSLGTTLLNAGQYEVHQVEAPDVPRAELAQAVRWKLQDQLTYPADEASVDVVDIPSDPNRAAETKSLYAVSARNDVIRTRVVDFHAAGVPLAIIDIPEMAQRNVALLCQKDARAVGLLAFTPSGALLTFVHGGELMMARSLDVTFDQLIDARGEAFESLLERVALELQRTYDHVDRRFNYAGVSRVVITPFPPGHGAAEYLANNLSFPLQQVDLNELMDLSAAEQSKDALWQTRNLHLLGAALREEAKAA